MFEREVEIMRLAAHPSCVSLKESIATSRYLYIVMELLGIFPHASNAMISTDLLCADAPEGGELCERISSRSHYSETEVSYEIKRRESLSAVCTGRSSSCLSFRSLSSYARATQSPVLNASFGATRTST